MEIMYIHGKREKDKIRNKEWRKRKQRKKLRKKYGNKMSKITETKSPWKYNLKVIRSIFHV